MKSEQAGMNQWKEKGEGDELEQTETEWTMVLLNMLFEMGQTEGNGKVSS